MAEELVKMEDIKPDWAAKYLKDEECPSNDVGLPVEQVMVLPNWDLVMRDRGVRDSYGRHESLFVEHQEQTLRMLRKLHSSLENRPDENDLAEQPQGITRQLYSYQLRALQFMLWRETQDPPGGVLADDMGLGKTLCVVALVVERLDKVKVKVPPKMTAGGTLVVAPLAVLQQWQDEFLRHSDVGLRVAIHQGKTKIANVGGFNSQDVVITSYEMVSSEQSRSGPLFKIYWQRIILDEGHAIRNRGTLRSEACCNLEGKLRWVLTGTPIHNREDDLFPILKFLRLSPFDNLMVFNRWAKESTSRLNVILLALLLRREKSCLMEANILKLPNKTVEEVVFPLREREKKIHDMLFVYAQGIMKNYLIEKAIAEGREPNFQVIQEDLDETILGTQATMELPDLRRVQRCHIFALIVRLRQICCHPALIKAMVTKYEMAQNGTIEGMEEEEYEAEYLDEAFESRVFHEQNPIFERGFISSKVQRMIDIINKRIVETRSRDKIVIVSEWVKYLEIIGFALETVGVTYEMYHGGLSKDERETVLESFGKKDGGPKVLLLSLLAGGCGLNLAVANHIFIMTVHWNPQIEKQAEDRIYRIGQEKPVTVYKFRAMESMEDRIHQVQQKKLDLAANVLENTRSAQSNLTLSDLMTLFDIVPGDDSQ